MLRGFRSLLFTIGALFLLALGILVLANWHDEALSELSLQSLAYTEPTDEQLRVNGYLILAGIEAPAPEEANADTVIIARELGVQKLKREIERWNWNQRYGSLSHVDAPKTLESQNTALQRQDIFDEALQCKPDQPDCFDWFLRHRQQLSALDANQRAVLARIDTIVRAPQYYSNVFPLYPFASFAQYGVLVAASELQLARASLLWSDEAHDQALDILEQSEKLRMRLGSSADMVASSIATLSMHHRNIKWISNAITRTGERMRPQDMERLQRFLETPRISMRHGFATDIALSASVTHSLGTYLRFQDTADAADKNQQAGNAPWTKRLRRTISALLYLPNQTTNITTERLWLFVEMADISPQNLAAAEELAKTLREERKQQHSHWLGARNAVGNYLLSLNDDASYVTTIQRGIDVDAYRRLVLLQLKAVQERIPENQMSDWLANSPDSLRNPYDLKPMKWDAASGSLTFEGRSVQTSNPEKSSTYKVRLRR